MVKAKIPVSQDITRTTLAVLFIGILIAASFWVVRPFLMSFVWATMIAVATWPVLLLFQARLWGKRGLAVAVMTVVLLLVLVVPLWLAIDTIIEKADYIVTWVKTLPAFSIPSPPGWLESIPLFGSKLVDLWQQLAGIHWREITARLTPYAGQVVSWFASQAGSVGMMIFHFLLTVIITAILYAKGETAAEGIRRFAHRLAGQQGEEAVVLSGKAIRGVALGVGLTAIIQSALGGLGLAITGVPAAALLTAVMFMLCIAQVGPILVLVPAVIWLYWKDATLWATVLLVWSIFVGAIDNFVRPALIKKGADLPLLMIFAGVIGGLVAFGIIGLFIGPVVLAVSHTLLKAWVAGEPQEAMAEGGQEEGTGGPEEGILHGAQDHGDLG
jgi:predicted PurR-regulated permease PerM